MHVLSAGDVTMSLVPERGGRIGQIEVAGRRLLRGEEDGDGAWHDWGCYPLAPWSNRIAGGRFSHHGQEWEMPSNFPDGTALHGLVADREWEVAEAGDTTAALTVQVDQPPFLISCRQEFGLEAGQIRISLSVTNDAEHDVPAGVGLHPWLPAGPMVVPAAKIWPQRDLLPIGPARPVRPAEDLRVPREPPIIDCCYTGLEANRAQCGDLVIEWSKEITQVVVYTGVPKWSCLEPVTIATDGFNSTAKGWKGHGVKILKPGATLAASFRLAWGE